MARDRNRDRATGSDWGSLLASDRPIWRRFKFRILRWVPTLALVSTVTMALVLVLELTIAIPETITVSAFSASNGRRILHARSSLSREDRFGFFRRRSTAAVLLLLLHEQEQENPEEIRNPQSKQRENQKQERETTLSPSIEWIPTRIEFEGVYRSYGAPSLWRKLTSSVPRRQWALENLTLVLGNHHERDNGNDNENNNDAIFLLLGASSSGKSTVLKSILGAGGRSTSNDDDDNNNEGFFASDQNRGSVRIVSNGCGKQPMKDQCAVVATPIQIPKPKPVLLDDRAELREENTVVGKGWDSVVCLPNIRGSDNGDRNGNGNGNGNGIGNENESGEQAEVFRRLLLEDTAALLDLDLDARVSDLTPSQRYKFVLGKACLESSTGGGTNGCDNNSYFRSQPQRQPQLQLPGPILLLDEWMDVESSVVVKAVQESLHRIANQRGGVVVSVTHKPGLYDGTSGNGSGRRIRTIKLSAGKLLRG